LPGWVVGPGRESLGSSPTRVSQPSGWRGSRIGQGEADWNERGETGQMGEIGELEPGLTSIVVIAYNGVYWTEKCVESILEHTEQPYELLLVDNGSEDSTGAYFRETAARHPRTTAILKDRNYGGYARSFGLEAASGEYVAWLDNDVEVGDGWLTDLRQVLADNPGIGATGPEGLAYCPDWTCLFYTQGWPPDRAAGRRADVLTGYCILMRNLVSYIGFLDPGFYPAWNEEADYCLRVKLLDFDVVVTPVPVVHHGHKTGFPGVKDVYGHIGRLNERLIKKWNPYKHLVFECFRGGKES